MNLAQQLVGKVVESRKRIVVVGDAMTDHYIHGRLAPSQDGCQKFVEESFHSAPGGAGNAVNCLRHWGVYLESFTRGDRSITKTRFIANDKIVFRWDDETDKERVEWTDRITLFKVIRRADAVLISDYDKGTLTPELIRDVTASCRSRLIPCVADCKREPEIYKGAILKVNSDYQYMYNQDLSNLVAASGDLVVTAGKLNPITWSDAVAFGLGYDLPSVTCLNHVGAGDCFAAHLTLALAYGFSLKDAAAIAHSAGRVYVQYAHNRPPYPDEVVADMERAASNQTLTNPGSSRATETGRQ